MWVAVAAKRRSKTHLMPACRTLSIEYTRRCSTGAAASAAICSRRSRIRACGCDVETVSALRRYDAKTSTFKTLADKQSWPGPLKR